MIPFPYVLRRRMMISGGGDAPFAFEYTGNYTDNRDANGIGTVEFASSGTLTVLSGVATVSAYILAGGGGGAYNTTIGGSAHYASGGGGGNQTVSVTLEPGTYDIVIGTGGKGKKGSANVVEASNGGNTIAFGYTSTGGGGGKGNNGGGGGTGGTPNGSAGTYIYGAGNQKIAGGSPNGGSATNNVSNNKGGDGLVRITFS